MWTKKMGVNFYSGKRCKYLCFKLYMEYIFIVNNSKQKNYITNLRSIFEVNFKNPDFFRKFWGKYY